MNFWIGEKFQVLWGRGKATWSEGGSPKPPSSKNYSVYARLNSGFICISIKLNPLNTKGKDSAVVKGVHYLLKGLCSILAVCIIFCYFFCLNKAEMGLSFFALNKADMDLSSGLRFLWSFILLLFLLLFFLCYFFFLNLFLFKFTSHILCNFICYSSYFYCSFCFYIALFPCTKLKKRWIIIKF